MKRSADVGRLMLEKTRENPASGIRYPISVLTMGPGSFKKRISRLGNPAILCTELCLL
ncbi:hypothetical protein SBDP1_410003 [Syntrophobacter sp. SbD1]|nr:hypothetical protein SBDP1_410003 [Syntrophobacter sp. SbD1]